MVLVPKKMEEMKDQQNGKASNKIKILFVVFLVASFFAGYFLNQYQYSSENTKSNRQVRQSGYKFINPLLECEVGNSSQESLAQADFKHNLEEFIDNEISKNKAAIVSVYFRDLNNGPWFGINETEEFSPASLLKVPLAMAYFNKSESNPEILSRKIKFEEKGSLDRDLMQNISPKEKIKSGEEYSAEELIEKMLVYSDNNAAELLLGNIDETTLNRAYSDLGIKVPNEIEADGSNMTVVSYASFFRILFNASYINEKNSEKLLEILSQSDFNDGLVAGVPSSVGVSHKFGERKISEETGATKQLHDCGIVYHSQYPYLLCVMTKGSDFEALKEVIKDVSRKVYSGVEEQYNKN